jgi:hypothetical protein
MKKKLEFSEQRFFDVHMNIIQYIYIIVTSTDTHVYLITDYYDRIVTSFYVMEKREELERTSMY